MHIPLRGAAAACLLEPVYGLIDPHLQQMSFANSKISVGQLRIARTEPNCLFLRPDRFIHWPNIGLTPAQRGQGNDKVTVKGECGLVFWNRLGVFALSTKHFGQRGMRAGTSRRRQHGLARELLRPLEVCVRRFWHEILDAIGQCAGQAGLCLRRIGIVLQRVLIPRDRFF